MPRWRCQVRASEVARAWSDPAEGETRPGVRFWYGLSHERTPGRSPAGLPPPPPWHDCRTPVVRARSGGRQGDRRASLTGRRGLQGRSDRANVTTNELASIAEKSPDDSRISSQPRLIAGLTRVVGARRRWCALSESKPPSLATAAIVVGVRGSVQTTFFSLEQLDEPFADRLIAGTQSSDRLPFGLDNDRAGEATIRRLLGGRGSC
jgi:hypothetical protein